MAPKFAKRRPRGRECGFGRAEPAGATLSLSAPGHQLVGACIPLAARPIDDFNKLLGLLALRSRRLAPPPF